MQKIRNMSWTSLKGDVLAHRRSILTTTAYCLSFIGLGFAISSLGPTLLPLAKKTNTSEDLIGSLFTARGLGYLLGSFSGKLYPRFYHDSSHAICIASVGVALIPLPSSFWGLVPLFALVGVNSGVMDTGLNTMLCWVWRDKVNPWMQLLHFSFGVGAFIGPLIIAKLVEADQGLLFQYISLAIPMALFAVPYLFLPSPSPDLTYEPGATRSSKITQSPDELYKPLNSSTGDFTLDDEIESSPTMTAPVAPSSTPHEKRLVVEVVVLTAAFLFVYVGAEVGYGGWLAAYATNVMGMDEARSAYITAAYWGSFSLGRFVGVFTALVLTSKQMIFTDVAVCGVSLAVILLFQTSETALWIGTVGLGAGLASIFPTAISLPQNFGMEVTGSATGWMVVGASAGEMTVPLLIGALQSVSIYALPWVIAGTLVIAVGIFGVILFRVHYVRTRASTVRFEFSLPSMDSDEPDGL